MKKLFLLRHAKSDYPANVNDDHERPLNKRGENDSRKMGEYFKKNNINPDVILCSDAKRTSSTIENIIRAAWFNKKPAFLKSLYLATPGEILKELAKIDNSNNSALVVAHNPGIEQLAKILIKTGNYEALSRIRIKYPTCALTILEINSANWQEINPASADIIDFITPKML